jgi:hypothetical protein
MPPFRILKTICLRHNHWVLLLLFSIPSLWSQEENSDSLPRWKHQHSIGILLNQASFSNWLAGGVNNFSGTFNASYNLNFKNKHWDWTNRLDLALGYARTNESSDYTKMDDQLVFQSVLKVRSEKAWNFSSSFDLKTQNAPGSIVLDKNQPDKIQSTHFFSPAYMQLGTGLAYAKGDSFQLQWNPINARVIVVDADFTKDLAAGETYFGVAAGKSSRWEAGVSVSMKSNIEVATNILLRNKLNVVTNYLEEFKNVDFDYTLTSQMKVNKHVSALFELQLIYDDNAIADLQVRQIFGLSIALPY